MEFLFACLAASPLRVLSRTRKFCARVKGPPPLDPRVFAGFVLPASHSSFSLAAFATCRAITVVQQNHQRGSLSNRGWARFTAGFCRLILCDMRGLQIIRKKYISSHKYKYIPYLAVARNVFFLLFTNAGSNCYACFFPSDGGNFAVALSLHVQPEALTLVPATIDYMQEKDLTIHFPKT